MGKLARERSIARVPRRSRTVARRAASCLASPRLVSPIRNFCVIYRGRVISRGHNTHCYASISFARLKAKRAERAPPVSGARPRIGNVSTTRTRELSPLETRERDRSPDESPTVGVIMIPRAHDTIAINQRSADGGYAARRHGADFISIFCARRATLT